MQICAARIRRIFIYIYIHIYIGILIQRSTKHEKYSRGQTKKYKPSSMTRWAHLCIYHDVWSARYLQQKTGWVQTRFIKQNALPAKSWTYITRVCMTWAKEKCCECWRTLHLTHHHLLCIFVDSMLKKITHQQLAYYNTRWWFWNSVASFCLRAHIINSSVIESCTP